MTHPSTTLRANGNYIDNIDHFPFVLRLSKHERIFSHTLRGKNRSLKLPFARAPSGCSPCRQGRAWPVPQIFPAPV